MRCATAVRPTSCPGGSRTSWALVLDDDRLDWGEVRELVTESYCLLAPKKLAAQVRHPGPP